MTGVARDFHSEKRYIRKNGEVVWVTVDAVMVHDDHVKDLYTVAVLPDITQSKAAEADIVRAKSRGCGGQSRKISFSCRHES